MLAGYVERHVAVLAARVLTDGLLAGYHVGVYHMYTMLGSGVNGVGA